MRRVLAIAMAMVAVLMACNQAPAQPMPPPSATLPSAPSPTALPTAAPLRAGIDYEVGIGQLGVVVKHAQHSYYLNQFQAAPPGRIFVLTNVFIRNHSATERRGYSWRLFHLRSSQDYQYSPTFWDDAAALHEGFLQPGEQVQGLVAFLTNVSDTTFTVSYDAFTDTPPLQVDFTLGPCGQNGC